LDAVFILEVDVETEAIQPTIAQQLSLVYHLSEASIEAVLEQREGLLPERLW
jgi:hypothetical protein